MGDIYAVDSLREGTVWLVLCVDSLYLLLVTQEAFKKCLLGELDGWLPTSPQYWGCMLSTVLSTLKFEYYVKL